MKCSEYIGNGWILTLLSVLFITPAAVGQVDQSDDLVRKAERAGIEKYLLNELRDRTGGDRPAGRLLVTVLRSATEMANNNLPYERIIGKAFEGISKGVSSDKVALAVVELHKSTETAADIVDRWAQSNAHSPIGSGNSEASRKGLTVALSNVIRSDLSSAAAEDILTALTEASLPSDTGTGELVAAIRIIPEIAAINQTGTTDGTATKFVIRALKGGFKSGDLQKLPAALKMAQARNQPFVSAVLQGRTGPFGGFPASQVIQNLMNGNAGAVLPGSIPVGLDTPANNLDIPGM